MKSMARPLIILVGVICFATVLDLLLVLSSNALAPQTPWQHWSRYAPDWYIHARRPLELTSIVAPGLVAGALLQRRSFLLGGVLGLLTALASAAVGVIVYGAYLRPGPILPTIITSVLLTSVSYAAGTFLALRRRS